MIKLIFELLLLAICLIAVVSIGIGIYSGISVAWVWCKDALGFNKSKEKKRFKRYEESVLVNGFEFKYRINQDIKYIIYDEIAKWRYKGYKVNDSFLLYMNEYLANFEFLRDGIVETLACFYKAVIEEPIFLNDTEEFDNLNYTFIDSVIKRTDKEVFLLYFKDEKYQYMNLYNEKNNDIYLICYYIVDSLTSI